MTAKPKQSNVSEFRTWLYAFLFMFGLSLAAFAVRFLIEPVFNVAFEIFVFYLPTALLLIIVLYLKKRSILEKNSQIQSEERT